MPQYKVTNILGQDNGIHEDDEEFNLVVGTSRNRAVSKIVKMSEVEAHGGTIEEITKGNKAPVAPKDIPAKIEVKEVPKVVAPVAPVKYTKGKPGKK